MAKRRQPTLKGVNGRVVYHIRTSSYLGPEIEKALRETVKAVGNGYNRSWCIADMLADYMHITDHLHFKEAGKKKRRKK